MLDQKDTDEWFVNLNIISESFHNFKIASMNLISEILQKLPSKNLIHVLNFRQGSLRLLPV